MVRAQHIVITLAEDLSAINMDAKFVQTKTNPRPLPDLDRVIEIPFRAGPSDTGRGGKFEG